MGAAPNPDPAGMNPRYAYAGDARAPCEATAVTYVHI